jgi:hypothetical protein
MISIIGQGRQIMHKQTLLAVAILLCATVVLGSCQGGDADQTKKADELEKISRSTPAERGAPGNPRGPADPSR